MGTRLGRTALLAAPLAAVVLAGTAWAQTDTSPQRAQETRVLRNCDGGAQEFSLVRTEDAATTIGETAAAVAVPGAVRTFTTPAGDFDQVRVLFTAETGLFGAPFDNSGGVDAVAVEIRLDGVALPGAGDLAFASDPFNASATEVCRRVGPGTHTVAVFWQVIDTGTNNALTGRIDDWSLDVQINN